MDDQARESGLTPQSLNHLLGPAVWPNLSFFIY